MKEREMHVRLGTTASSVATPAVRAWKENKLFGAAPFDLRVQATTYRTVYTEIDRENYYSVFIVYTG